MGHLNCKTLSSTGVEMIWAGTQEFRSSSLLNDENSLFHSNWINLSLFIEFVSIYIIILDFPLILYQIVKNCCCHNRFSWFLNTHVGESSWNVLNCVIYSNGKHKITILTFTHWKRCAPFSFLACDRKSTNSCVTTGTPKLYRPPMSEVFALYSAIRWCNGRRTKC